MKFGNAFPTYLFNINSETLRIAAKLTHRIYGKSNIAAGFEIAKNLLMLQNMAAHRKIMTAKPPAIDRPPKNTIDQRALSANCRKNIKIAPLAALFLRPFCQTRNKEIPIMANKVVQTGPKTASGGLNDGFFIKAYHSDRERKVKKDPIIPADSQTSILATNFVDALHNSNIDNHL